MASGSISNVVNRMWYQGEITNFIDMGLNADLRWYVFGLGDAFVTIGCLWFVVWAVPRLISREE
jgi:lipoprotein signal peptidase